MIKSFKKDELHAPQPTISEEVEEVNKALSQHTYTLELTSLEVVTAYSAIKTLLKSSELEESLGQRDAIAYKYLANLYEKIEKAYKEVCRDAFEAKPPTDPFGF